MIVIQSDTNNEIQHTLQGSDSIQFIKLHKIRRYEHTERVNDEGKAKTSSDCQNGSNKGKKAMEKWTDEFEEDLIMGGRNWYVRARD